MARDQYSASIYDQMRRNRWRTAYLFLMFPIVILGLTYIGLLISIGFSEGSHLISPIDLANEMMQTIGFWVIVAVFGWSLVSYFLGSKMLMAFAGAKPIQKKDNPQLFRIVENISIAAGLPKTPDIYIINDASMNAFATGRSPMHSSVAISTGLLEQLTKAELEGVMAHEVGHIINRDIRVMMLAVTLVGAIQMAGEILIRTRGGGSRNNRGGNPLIIIGILFITIGVLVGSLTRLALSREREYLADATGAHLSNNPDALASALRKIAGDARIEKLDGKASIAGLCIADPSASGHKHHHSALNNFEAFKKPQQKGFTAFWHNIWSTHPPITDRIKRLRGY